MRLWRRSTADLELLVISATRECRDLNELVHLAKLGASYHDRTWYPPPPPLPDPGTGGWPRRAAAKAELAHYRWVASKLRLQAYDVGALR